MSLNLIKALLIVNEWSAAARAKAIAKRRKRKSTPEYMAAREHLKQASLYKEYADRDKGKSGFAGMQGAEAARLAKRNLESARDKIRDAQYKAKTDKKKKR